MAHLPVLRLTAYLTSLYSGYLPPGEVEHLTMAYTTVYNLGLDKGEIMAAMNYARTTDIRSPPPSPPSTSLWLNSSLIFVHKNIYVFLFWELRGLSINSTFKCL
jgi:hypothetical protein